jgi:hypothetical protein
MDPSLKIAGEQSAPRRPLTPQLTPARFSGDQLDFRAVRSFRKSSSARTFGDALSFDG